MSAPNRYLLSQYSAAEIAALDESEKNKTLLWWLTWQACGATVKLPTMPHHTVAFIDGRDGWIMDWFIDEPAPRKFDSEEIIRRHRPSLEAVLDALAEHPNAARLNFKENCIEDEMTCRLEGSPAPDNYTAATRALLAWKRGQG